MELFVTSTYSRFDEKIKFSESLHKEMEMLNPKQIVEVILKHHEFLFASNETLESYFTDTYQSNKYIFNRATGEGLIQHENSKIRFKKLHLKLVALPICQFFLDQINESKSSNFSVFLNYLFEQRFISKTEMNNLIIGYKEYKIEFALSKSNQLESDSTLYKAILNDFPNPLKEFISFNMEIEFLGGQLFYSSFS